MVDIKTIIGKIKGKPDVFWAAIKNGYSYSSYNYQQHDKRVKTTQLLNLTYLEFLLCTKKASKNKININKNEFNKLIKLNTESYIDWAVIELINSITINNNIITIKDNNNNDIIEIDNNAITIHQTKTQALKALRELIDFWK